MTDFLSNAYLWTKAFHIVSVISWMAGLFYLPRLFVYHSEQVGQTNQTHSLFCEMERKLFRLIMNPAMISTWIFGLCLVFTPGIVDWTSIWPWAKAVGVIGMTVFHHWLGSQRKSFENGQNNTSGRNFRLMNEVPTIFLILIVFSVVLKF